MYNFPHMLSRSTLDPFSRLPLNPNFLFSWSGDSCSNHWIGVTCDNGSVVRLELGANGIRGTIPTTLGSLSSLTFLELMASSLSGSLPSSLGALTVLAYLSIPFSRLSGTLPSELASLSAISFFNIKSNPCLFGPLVSVGHVGTSYDISGTALGTPSLPDSCNSSIPSPDRGTMLAISAIWCARVCV